MQNLGLTEEDFNKQSEIENIFQNVENLKDHRFGEIALLTSEQNPNVIIMRKEKFSSDENECCKDILEAKQRKKMEHPSILQMPDFSTKVIQNQQGLQEILVSGYYEYPDWDLEREIDQRLQNQKYFEPEILVKIIFEILNAMAYLQSNKMIHGDLRPKYISYSNDLEFPFQLCDRLGDPFPPNKVQINNLKKNRPLYMSPILFKSLSLRKKRIRHNPYKSEVFSLGMIILEAGILENIQSIYDKDQKQINVEEMLKYIEKFMEIYGEHDLLRESLIWMLDLNGHNRRDPKTLVEMIQKYAEELNEQNQGNQEEEQNEQQQEVLFEKESLQSQDQQSLQEVEVNENLSTENLHFNTKNQQQQDNQNFDNQFDKIRKERQFNINEDEYENLNIDDEGNNEDQYENLNIDDGNNEDENLYQNDNQQQNQDQFQHENQQELDKDQNQFDFNKIPLLDNYQLKNNSQEQPKVNLNLEIQHKQNFEEQKQIEDQIEWKDDQKYLQQQNDNLEPLDDSGSQDLENDLLKPKHEKQIDIKNHLLSNFEENNITSQLQTQNSRVLTDSKYQNEIQQNYNQNKEQKQQIYEQNFQKQNNNNQQHLQNQNISNNNNNLHLYKNLNQQQNNIYYPKPSSIQNNNIQQKEDQKQIIQNQHNQQQNQNQTQNYVHVKQVVQEISYKPNNVYQNNQQQTLNYQHQNQEQNHQNQQQQNIVYKKLNQPSNQYQQQQNSIQYPNQKQTQQTPIQSHPNSQVISRNQYSMNKELLKFTENSTPSHQRFQNDFEPSQLLQSQTQQNNKVSITKDAPLSIQINQNFEQRNIYQQKDTKQIIDKPKRRTVKAKSSYPFNDSQYSRTSQTELQTKNSNQIKREYYVSPSRLREFKESISREPQKQNMADNTFDYKVKREQKKNVRRVYLTRNNESIFKEIADGSYPELNSIYNKPQLEQEWKERYGSDIEIVNQQKNYQVFRLSHSRQQNSQYNNKQM